VHLAAGNPKVQRLRRLIGRRSARYDEGLFVIEGSVLVQDAIDAGCDVVEVFIREDRATDETWLRRNPIPHDIPVFTLDVSVFDAASDTTTPQGISAVCAIPELYDQPWLTQDVQQPAWVIVADAVNDPGNLGTIIRSGEVAGAHAIVVLNNTVDPYSPKTARASAGALFHVPVISHLDYNTLVSYGFRLVGTTSREDTAVKARSLYDFDCSGRLAIVLGNEAHGIAKDAPIDEWLTIEHVGRSESLNVAMAASIISMHVAHERGNAANLRSGKAKR
jgi:TrmH family RNA methyltransferase